MLKDLSADSDSFYVKNSKDFTKNKNLLELINKFAKVAGDKRQKLTKMYTYVKKESRKMSHL
jgi:hypothetical protein